MITRASGEKAPAPKTAAAKRAARGKSGWRQAEIKRAIDAAEAAGLASYRVEAATDGTISIIVGEPAQPSEPAAGGDRPRRQ